MGDENNQRKGRGTAHPGVLRRLKKITEELKEELPFAADEMDRLDKLAAQAIETNRSFENRLRDEDEDFRAVLNTIFRLEGCIKRLPDKHPDPSKQALYERCKVLARRKGYRV